VHVCRKGGEGIESTRRPLFADNKLTLKVRLNDKIAGLINVIKHK